MYKCLSHASYGKEYQLLPIQEGDMERIRLWRNRQIDVLRQNEPLTADAQKKYFDEKILPTFTQDHPPQILFSFLKDHHPIGYGGLTHIDWEEKKGEVSFLLDPDHLDNYSQKFSHFLNLLIEVAFHDLKLTRLFTETYAFRKEHIQILEAVGFQLQGRLKNRVIKKGQTYDAFLHTLFVI